MRFSLRNLFVLALMLFASGMAIVMRPTQRIADLRPRVNLEQMVPLRFADWIVDPSVMPVLSNPGVQEQIDILYEQTLSRTYINRNGLRVMLSIAYGGDQSGDKTQVHRPEFCYDAQGFRIKNKFENKIVYPGGVLPVRRLEAVQGSRNEPITYWITVGDNVTLPGIGRKLIQMRYGITGRVPDGMLVRVSSIDQNATKAYQLQDLFVRDMLAAISEQDRLRVAGHLIY